MSTALNLKDVIDLQRWRAEAPSIAATGAAMCMTNDLRNDTYRSPYVYLLRSNTNLDVFNTRTGDWMALATPALAGTFGAGAACTFVPSHGPRGTLAAGSTTSAIVVTAAILPGLPSTIGVNQLANAGKGVGFRIRVIGSGTSGSGKTEERTIIGNTTGSTPTIYLDTPLSFTPTSTDKFEILSGRVYLLGASTIAAGIWKYYDVASNSYSGSLGTTNLPTLGTDSQLVPLSELYVPNDTVAGAGFVTGASTWNAASPIGCISATAVTNTTNAVVTGAGMPSTLATNEYRNFQLRIVEDTTNTTAVGQRIRITSHTSGATGAFTCGGVFGVAPSNTAKFVVENDDSKILLRTSGAVLIYNYNAYAVSGTTADTWDTSTWAAPVANGAGGWAAQAFGPSRDVTGAHRHSFIHFGRGAATSIDVLDIAGAATGAWSNAVTYQGLVTTMASGTSAAYDSATQGGRFVYINISGTQRFQRYDLKNRMMEPHTYLWVTQGATVIGNKMACALFVDGTTKLNFAYHLTHTQTYFFGIPTPDNLWTYTQPNPLTTTFTSTTSAQMLANNGNRKGFSVWNQGAGTLYILLGTGTATTSFATIPVYAGDFYSNTGHTGVVTAIFGTAGTAIVTENI